VVIVGGHYGHWELIVPLLANKIHNALVDREVRGRTLTYSHFYTPSRLIDTGN
jgi:hypothetical protein